MKDALKKILAKGGPFLGLILVIALFSIWLVPICVTANAVPPSAMNRAVIEITSEA